MTTRWLYLVIAAALLFSSATSQTIAWKSLNELLWGYPTTSPVLHPSGRIFAASGTLPVLRETTDRGVTWRGIPTTLPTEIIGLACDPSGVLMAASSTTFYRSIDTGRTWTDTVLLVMGSYAMQFFTGPTLAILACDQTNFQSTDHGLTWAQLPLARARTQTQFLSSGCPTPDGSFLLAGDTLYITSNNGASWQPLGPVLPARARSIVSDAHGVLYLGTQGDGVYRSSDRGETWVHRDSLTQGKTVYGMFFTQDSTLLAVCNDDILRSTDRGDTWAHAKEGFLTTPSVPFLCEPGGNVFAAGIDGAIYQTTSAAIEWQANTVNLNYQFVRSLQVTPNGRLLAGASWHVYRTDDRGATWLKETTGFTKSEVLSCGRTRSGAVLVGTSGGELFRSADNGETWGLVRKDSLPFGIEAIAVDTSGLLAAGLYGGGLLFSSDDGLHWAADTSGSINRWVRCLAFSQARTLLVGTDSGLFAHHLEDAAWQHLGLADTAVMSLTTTSTLEIVAGTLANGIVRSPHPGGSWTSSGLDSWTISDLVTNRQNAIFAATLGGGVYESTDGGLTWKEANGGLPERNVLSLALDEAGLLYAGLFGRGVYCTTASTLVGVAEAERAGVAGDFALSQNWPNPWNPSTTIGYTVGGIGDQGSGSRNVKLTIYNVLGQEVAVLVNEKLAPGRYAVRFDASHLASGVYLYRLQAGAFVETKKMLLIR